MPAILRVIPPQTYSSTMNMALDHILLHGSGTVLRFYLWERPTLSMGFSQKKVPDVDLDFCKEHNIELIQRETGGQAVLHHLELTYSVVGDVADFSRSILQTYQAISGPLTSALQSLGLDVTMAEHPKTGKPPKGKESNCFQEISNFEVAVKGKKIIGSAQVRKGKRFLQHGSILLSINKELWEGLWPKAGGIAKLKQRFTSLEDEGISAVNAEQFVAQLAEKIGDAFQKNWAVELKSEDFTRAEIEKAHKIAEQFVWANQS